MSMPKIESMKMSMRRMAGLSSTWKPRRKGTARTLKMMRTPMSTSK